MSKDSQIKPSNGNVSAINSIKTKLIVVMLLVAAIPLAVAVLVSYVTSSQKAMEDAQRSLETEAKYIRQRFVNVMDANVNMIRSIADNPTVINFLTGEAGIPADAVVSTIAVCDNVLNDGDSMAITDATGMQVARSKGDCIDVSDREYFQQCKAGNSVVYVSNVTVSKTNGRRFITFAAPIMNGDEFLGIVHRNYDLNNFHEMLAQESDDAFLVDRDGLVAAHSQYEIGEGAHEEESRAKSEFMVSGKNSGFYNVDTGKGYDAYVAYVKDENSGFCVCAADDEKTVLAASRRSATIVVVSGIIMLIIAVIVSLLISVSFTSPIQAVNKSLAALADGRFNKVSKHGARKDELGAMANATNTVIERLDEIVGGIKNSASGIGKSSDELSDMATAISQTAEDVSNAVQEIATGATQQAEEIQDANENVAKIGDAVEDVKDSATALTELANKMKSASEVSGKSLEALRKSSEQMTQKIDEISNTIQATQDAVNNISEKVEGITSIATQTNLLSLNASIEAARAGEAGRGFAVVAEEIGKLADDSKTMADEIRIEMDALLGQSALAVAAAENVKQGNNDQQASLGETIETVNGMLTDIDSTVSGVKQISRGAEVCDSSKNAVVDTMSALSAISEENAASSEETGASMEELSATVTTLAASANDLKDIANKLNEDMKFFKEAHE